MSFFINYEGKIFCLLTVAFLFLFQIKSFNPIKHRFAYVFPFAGIILSLLCEAEKGAAQNLWLSLCTLCAFLSAFFLGEYALEISKIRKALHVKAFLLIFCAAFSLFSFYSIKAGMNSAFYITVFVLTVIFVNEQYNRIRVDNLTKLYNRYGMDAELREQLRQHQRDKNDSFYIIACDLDNFKYINDTWGHPEGDRALILIADALSRVGKRFNSGVFRIGGDEFVIITDTSEKGLAESVENAIKNELDNIRFRDDFEIKISMGTALYDGLTPVGELLNSADKRLYEAKKRQKKA